MPLFLPPAAPFFQTMFAGIGKLLSTNGTAEQSIIPSGLGSKVIPAGALKPGSIYRLLLAGQITTVAVPGSVTFRTKLNGTIVTSAATVSLLGGQTDVGFQISQTFQCYSDGSLGKVSISGRAKYPSGALSQKGEADMQADSLTVDTTVAQAIDVTAQFGITGSSVKVLTCGLEVVAP